MKKSVKLELTTAEHALKQAKARAVADPVLILSIHHLLEAVKILSLRDYQDQISYLSNELEALNKNVEV